MSLNVKKKLFLRLPIFICRIKVCVCRFFGKDLVERKGEGDRAFRK